MKLRSIASLLVPAVGLALGTAATSANAATQREARVLIGTTVTDIQGREVGTIRSVVVDRDGEQATLVVAQPSGVDDVLRVPIDATLAAQRGDRVMLTMTGTTANPAYVTSSTPPRRWHETDVRISSDRRLSKLIGTRVEDARGTTLGEVDRVALRDTRDGEKAFAVVEPEGGGRPLVVPLGYADNVRMELRGRDHPREVIVDRFDGEARIRW